MLYIIEKIKGNLEDNNDTGDVFLDLANAFNSISNEIFLKKLKISTSQSTVLLLKSFLENRTQGVKLGIVLSDKITINHSVPQGTVLGPLIFPLYVNDFSEKLEGKNDDQFAEDTSIICKFGSNENIPQKIEKIEHADKYLTENQLTLNADKTEMLFFTNHTNSDPEFSFKGKVIKPAHACRYLGVKLIQT